MPVTDSVFLLEIEETSTGSILFGFRRLPHGISNTDSKTGNTTKPWYRPNATTRKNIWNIKVLKKKIFFCQKKFVKLLDKCWERNFTLKNVKNTWDSEAQVVIKARNVLKPPFITAGPISAKVWIARLSPFSPGVIMKVWAMWAA